MAKPEADFIKSLASLPFLGLNIFFCSLWEAGGELRFKVSRQLRFRGLNCMYDPNWSFSEGLTLLTCLISFGRLPHCEIPLTADVSSIYMLLLGLCELPCPQGALLPWQCINRNWNFGVNGAESINCFKSLCDLHCPRGHAVIVVQRSHHALMLPGLDSLLLEIARTKLYMDTGK